MLKLIVSKFLFDPLDYFTKTKGLAAATFFSLIVMAIFLTSSSFLWAQNRDLALGYLTPDGGIAIYAAISQGYFAEEGLNVTPVAIKDAANFKTLIENKTIVGGEFTGEALVLAANGLNIGFTAGLYSGFLEIIGLPLNPGQITLVTVDPLSGPAVAAARRLRALGLNPDQDVKWTTAPEDQLTKTLLKGAATDLARWNLAAPAPKEPWAPAQVASHDHGGGHGHGGQDPKASAKSPATSSDLSHGHKAENKASPDSASPSQPSAHGHGPTQDAALNSADQDSKSDSKYAIIFSARALLPKAPPGAAPSANPHAHHTAEHHLFNSFVVLSGQFIKDDQKTAVAVTRALIRGARWTGENKDQAADLGLDKKLWPGDRQSLVGELGRYMWMPGVSQAKEHLKTYIHEGIGRGKLPAQTDEKAFFDKVFIQLLPDLN
ncbi:MAG: hypothetical protein LBI10_11470 [Deltaproteobacteria bacterium]|jgi:ABC-type nitrate/sulfonate/bicarbonate transport system substrate-binding protein|nr:hypothetical protein [Deltaproteobacteria bacterium]